MHDVVFEDELLDDSEDEDDLFDLFSVVLGSEFLVFQLVQFIVSCSSFSCCSELVACWY